MFQILLSFLITLALTGCSSGTYDYTPKEFYSLQDTLRGEILAEYIKSKNGAVRLYYTKYGLLASTKSDNNIFQLLDSTDAKQITSVGKKGRGPDELLAPQGMQYEYVTNRFSAFDMYKQELVTYQVFQDTLILLRSLNLKKDLQSVKYLNDSLIVFVNYYPDQKIGLMNANAEILYEAEYNPLNDKRIKTSQAYYTVKLDVSPDRQYTVAVERNFPSIKVYKNGANKLELKWEKMLFKPRYSVRSGKEWYVQHDESFLGFRSLYLTSDYIYLSCDDVKFRDLKEERPLQKHTYLLVMDYEGNLIDKYLLDNYFVPFTVSPDGKSMYAVIYDPDILIAKYKLK